jgi:hypothetical protein
MHTCIQTMNMESANMKRQCDVIMSLIMICTLFIDVFGSPSLPQSTWHPKQEQ